MPNFFEPAQRGVQHATLRAANRRAVLTTVSFSAGVSNADVARRTGLAPQTASAIVAELETEGLITRGEVLRGRRGQPATPLLLNYDGAYAIGCEVSWDHVEVVLIDLGSRQLGRYRRDFEAPDPTTIGAELIDAVSGLLAKLDKPQKRRVSGIGIAMPTRFGQYDPLRGGAGQQQALWRQLDLRDLLESRTGITTYAYDDGSTACWAHLMMAEVQQNGNFAYLFVGPCLAAGIAARHVLWEGPSGNPANLGAMLICKREGGREFGHRLASLTGLRQRLAAAGIEPRQLRLADWPWRDWEHVLAPWLDEAGYALAQIVLNTAAVVEIDRAVIDGALPASLVQRLVATTRAAMEELPSPSFERPQLLAGKLGAIAPVLGAAQLCFFRKHFSRQLADMHHAS